MITLMISDTLSRMNDCARALRDAQYDSHINPDRTLKQYQRNSRFLNILTVMLSKGYILFSFKDAIAEGVLSKNDLKEFELEINAEKIYAGNSV